MYLISMRTLVNQFQFYRINYNFVRLVYIFNIVTYRPSKKEEWNTFVDRSRNATFLFHRDFMEYHKDRFDDQSLLVYKDTGLVAIFPANSKNQIMYSHQGLTYGGFIFENDAPE